MSLSNPNKPVTEQRLQEFYHEIEPYMGGGGGTGGGGHTIEDSEGTDLTQRDTMQFGDGFNATDDSENEKTVVEPNLMTAADMDDVVTPLPSVRSSYQKYSTEEQIVGEWIDGKPIYQKTITGRLTYTTGSTLQHEVLTDSSLATICETVVGLSGFATRGGVLTSPFIGAFVSESTPGINQYCSCRFNISTGEFALDLLYPASNQTIDVIVTIQYTKTTS